MACELRAARAGRGVEGPRRRAALQGDPQRARLLLPAPALRLPVHARRRPRAAGRGAPRRALARLRAERAARARADVPRRARARLLGGPTAGAGGQVGHLPRQARGQPRPHARGGGAGARALRRVLRHRPRPRAARARGRRAPGHARAGRRRHAVRGHDRQRAGARATLPRPAAARPGARAARDREGHGGAPARRAAGRRGPLGEAARGRRHRLPRRESPHLRRRAGGLRRMVKTLGWLAAASVAAGLVMAFGVAPREDTQGNVQRIMYVHVPLILASYLAFAVLALASLVYLVRRDEAADRVAHPAPAAVAHEARRLHGIVVDPLAPAGEPHRLRPALRLLRRSAGTALARGSRGGGVMADNWGFVAAAYGLTAVALLIYWRRLAKKEREVEALRRPKALRS